jgi:fatty acid desaturase
VTVVRNPISLFWKWLHYVLFEEIDDPRVPNPKRRKIIHNAHLIQVWAMLAGIASIGLIPLCVWLITVPGFVIAYIVWCAVMGVANVVLSLYVRRLNEEDYLKTSKSASDALYEYGW